MRAGHSYEHPDEGPDTTDAFAGAGLGLEHAGDGGFTWWAEALPTAVDFDDVYTRGWRPGLLINLGLGYRFRR
jgi:hypothetical protein